MSKYYVAGYHTPDGVTDSEGVKAWQKKLGVAQDGIWGKNTQAAYEKYTNAGVIDGFDWDKASAMITEQLTKALRPAVESAIAAREESGDVNRAELDADAASRGMNESTVVSSLKQRESANVASDIAGLEAEYQSTLASNLYSALISMYETYTDATIEREKLAQERELELARLAQEKELADREYELQKARYSASGSTTGSGEDSSGMIGYGYNYSDYLSYINNLSEEGRKLLFESDGTYWRFVRDTIKADLGEEGYYSLCREYYDFEEKKKEKQDENYLQQ